MNRCTENQGGGMVYQERFFGGGLISEDSSHPVISRFSSRPGSRFGIFRGKKTSLVDPFSPAASIESPALLPEATFQLFSINLCVLSAASARISLFLFLFLFSFNHTIYLYPWFYTLFLTFYYSNELSLSFSLVPPTILQP